MRLDVIGLAPMTFRTCWKPQDGLPFGRPAARILIVASRFRRWIARSSIRAIQRLHDETVLVGRIVRFPRAVVSAT